MPGVYRGVLFRRSFIKDWLVFFTAYEYPPYISNTFPSNFELFCRYFEHFFERMSCSKSNFGEILGLIALSFLPNQVLYSLRLT